jgi:CRISPR-associated protein Cas1
MRRVYILEPGTYLRKAGENLCLTREGKSIEEIPLSNLEQLTLVGYTSLSGAVLNTLIANRVETVLIDPKGRFKGRLCVDEHKHVKRRMAQYLKLSKPEFALKTARYIVRGKLRNQARFLALRGKYLKNEAVLGISAALRALDRELDYVDDLELVRGIEGHGARLYFQAFGHLIQNSEFTFLGRNRRPPLDPINALLSFVYTLLTNEVLTAIKTVGLDPYLGALHAIDYGRPSLACDLVEEWRAYLGDRLTLTLVNRKSVSPDDFVYRRIQNTDFVDEEDLKQKRPVEMKPGVCRAFLETYERLMQKTIKNPDTGKNTTYRNMILYQVRLFEEYLMDKKETYQPFSWSKIS